MNVTWAYCIKNDEIIKPVEKIVIPVLSLAKPELKTDRESQIQAIEAKLKLMEQRNSEELKINDTVATKAPVIAQYQHKKSETKTYSSIKVQLSQHRRLKSYKKNYTT
ncbi:hypothetical protein WA026_006635 [Henosepilachna vigintioctopunctata]|uniref:Uncharacterized protein n=1 Tax=Henosepilachna vigintioctopunctata TaxID=420089 RepID=A0AAW1U7B9_9CUCU